MLVEALQSLVPDVPFAVFGEEVYENVEWPAGGPSIPTKGQVDAEIERLTLQHWRQHTEVSIFQAQAALTLAGYMDDIEAYLSSTEADPITVLAWNKAQAFKRLSPTVLELAALLGITDEQLDDLFRFAATIEA